MQVTNLCSCLLLASAASVEQTNVVKDVFHTDEEMTDDVDGVRGLAQLPSSSATKRSHRELVTHHDFQPALIPTDDDGLSHVSSLVVIIMWKKNFMQSSKCLSP